MTSSRTAPTRRATNVHADVRAPLLIGQSSAGSHPVHLELQLGPTRPRRRRFSVGGSNNPTGTTLVTDVNQETTDDE